MAPNYVNGMVWLKLFLVCQGGGTFPARFPNEAFFIFDFCDLQIKCNRAYFEFWNVAKLPRKSIPRDWQWQSFSPAYDFHILQAAVEQKQSLVKDGVAAPLLTAAALLHAAAPPAVAAAAPPTVTAADAAAVSDAVAAAVSMAAPDAVSGRIYPTGISCGTYFL